MNTTYFGADIRKAILASRRELLEVTLLGIAGLLLATIGFAQDAITVLDRKATSTEVIEFLVTPSGLFPKRIEAPPGDYVLVVRRTEMEAPLQLELGDRNGRRLPVTSMSAQARSKREVIRLRPGMYTASISGSTEKEWTATIRIRFACQGKDRVELAGTEEECRARYLQPRSYCISACSYLNPRR